MPDRSEMAGVTLFDIGHNSPGNGECGAALRDGDRN